MKALIPLATLALSLAPVAQAQHAGHAHPPAQAQATRSATAAGAASSAARADDAKQGHDAHHADDARGATLPAGHVHPPAGGTAAGRAGMDHSKMQHTGGAHGAMEHAEHDHAKHGQAGMDHSKSGHAQGDHAGMDHSKMDHAGGEHAQMDHAKHDHAGMDHSKMDHSKMDHSKMSHASDERAAMDHSKMDHSKMDDAGMHHPPGRAPELPADAAPRTPLPPITDADRAAAFPQLAHGHATHDRRIHSYWLADRLEWQEGEVLAWEGLAWIGGDIHRLWLRTEGEASGGEVEHGDVELLYGRSVTPWWDVLAGVSSSIGHGPSRQWAAFGVQGHAPYKFEVKATGYLGAGGRTATALEVEYDTLLARRTVLQWQLGAHVYGKDDPEAGVGAGLSTVEAGARLRYEFSRRFAPYVGLQVERAHGATADLRRAEGDPVRDTRLVAGLRVWF